MNNKGKREIKDFRYSFSMTGAAVFIAAFVLIMFSEMLFSVDIGFSEKCYRFFNLCMEEWGSVILGIIGAAFGFSQFAFVFSQKKSDMLLSCGISRGRILFNRALSGVVTLTALSFLVEMLDFCFNAIAVGVTGQLAAAVFALFIVRLCPLLFGFACACLACISAGGKIKKVLCAVSLLLILPLCFRFTAGICDMFVSDFSYDLLVYNPIFELLMPFCGYTGTYPLLDLCGCVKPGADIDYYAVITVLASKIVWCALCFLMIFAAQKLFVKIATPFTDTKTNRFAEISVILFAMASVLRATVNAFRNAESFRIRFASGEFSGALPEPDAVFCRKYFAGVCIAAIILTALLITAALKFLKFRKKSVCIALAGIVLLCCFGAAAGATGRFGAYLNVPDDENIVQAQIFSDTNALYPDSGTVWCSYRGYSFDENIFEGEEGIAAVTKLHKELLNGDVKPKFDPFKRAQNNITVEYVLKNGNVLRREFTDTSRRFFDGYFALYDLKEYKDSLRKSLEADLWAPEYSGDDYAYASYTDYLNNEPIHAIKTVAIVSNSQKRSAVPGLEYDDICDLSKILLDEYCALSFDELFKSGEKPLFFISFYGSDDSYFIDTGGEDDTFTYSIPVFAGMKRTLAALKKYNAVLPEDENESIDRISVFDYGKLVSARREKGSGAESADGSLAADGVYILKTLNPDSAFYRVNFEGFESYYGKTPDKYDYSLFFDHASETGNWDNYGFDSDDMTFDYDEDLSGAETGEEEFEDEPADAPPARVLVCEPEKVITDPKECKALYKKCLSIGYVPENAKLALVEFKDGTSWGYVIAE